METASITLPAKQARPRDAQGKFLPRVPDLTSSPETQSPPSPSPSVSSVSSDSSDGPAFTLPSLSTTMTAATITSTHGKPPVFSVGDITPLNARQFEEACLGYFRSAKEAIPANKQTGRILGCFAGLEVNDWISVHSDDLLTKTFPEFMAAFRAEFLETDWSEKADAKLRVYKQGGKTFKEWINSFRHQVLILKGTPEELTEKEQRKLILSLMDEHLRTRASKFKAEQSFKTWLELVTAEDISIRADYAQFKRLERANTPKSSPAPKRTKANNGSAFQRDGNGNRVAPPALTDEERTILTEFGGCFKCRNYDANHLAKDCPNGFPDGRDYEERTRTHAQGAVIMETSDQTSKSFVNKRRLNYLSIRGNYFPKMVILSHVSMGAWAALPLAQTPYTPYTPTLCYSLVLWCTTGETEGFCQDPLVRLSTSHAYPQVLVGRSVGVPAGIPTRESGSPTHRYPYGSGSRLLQLQVLAQVLTG